ncbi:MAG TPA: transaldolase [Streptosporangiaceae bacterium]|jgi:transaldolase|nr:transaldolase [Streptosporangiaceae bacterium]
MTTQQDKQDVLGQLTAEDVSIWLDDISRERLTSGNLAMLVKDFHVRGVTSNPTIFAHSMEKGTAYDEQLGDLALRGVDVGDASRSLTTFDIRWACDVLRPVFDASDGVDGKVSIEVDPRLAADTAKTIAEARALNWLVDRPNVYIKIPATRAGLPAITACLAEGININVTLIFALERYEEVIDAFMSGLEQADEAHVATLTSVASFFVSRVDTEVDRRLDGIGSPEAQALRGKAAIANARLAYEIFEKHFASPRWQALSNQGARVQRPLWASTSTKDPAYRDTMYVEDLIAPHTVNTMPEATMHAMADHGVVRGNTIAGTYDEARQVFADLEKLGISYDDVVAVLEDEGVRKFSDSWDGLLKTISEQLDPAKSSAVR